LRLQRLRDRPARRRWGDAPETQAETVPPDPSPFGNGPCVAETLETHRTAVFSLTWQAPPSSPPARSIPETLETQKYTSVLTLHLEESRPTDLGPHPSLCTERNRGCVRPRGRPWRAASADRPVLPARWRPLRLLRLLRLSRNPLWSRTLRPLAPGPPTGVRLRGSLASPPGSRSSADRLLGQFLFYTNLVAYSPFGPCADEPFFPARAAVRRDAARRAGFPPAAGPRAAKRRPGVKRLTRMR
jgi:hypothetical protein